MNGHKDSEGKQKESNPVSPVIIENHYPTPSQQHNLALKDNIIKNDIGNFVGLSPEEIDDLQNIMIQKNSSQIEGDAPNLNHNNSDNVNNVNNVNINNAHNLDKSIFETDDIGEPDIENNNNNIVNNNNKSVETPQIPPDDIIDSNIHTPQKPISVKVTKGGTTKTTRGGKTTRKGPSTTAMESSFTPAKIWNWINNNCFRPFISSFQQQIIADSIQIGLSIFPIIPIWRYLPERICGKPIDVCQDKPEIFWENRRQLANQPKPKKSILKRLWSVEGFFIISVIGTLLTVVLIDNDDSTPTQRPPQNRQPHPQQHNRPNYFQNYSYPSAYQAASVPQVPQSPNRGHSI